MSPHLFLLCMEYLSRLLAVRTRSPDFQFHTKCISNSITHMAFADNLLLFARADPALLKILAETLDEFTLTSGLQINRRKSQLFLAGVRPFEKEQILDLFNFPLGELPIKYLGLPLSSRRLNIQHYSPLIDQIMASINRWSNSYLSLAG